MTTAQLHYDPFDSILQGDPYPVYRRLRNESARIPGGDV